MSFLTDALDVLRSPEAPPGLKEAACAALVAALDEHIDVPATAPLAIWTWIRDSTSRRWCAAEFTLGEIPNDQVFEAAVAALHDPASGNSLRELAYDVLTGEGHAGRVPASLLAHVVDGDPGHMHQAMRLITHVHGARGLLGGFLRSVRDRWAASPLASARQAAVEIASITIEHDAAFWERMLEDPSEDVRCTVASHLRKHTDPKFGIAIIRQRLEREQVVEVQAELHRAMTVLLKLADE